MQAQLRTCSSQTTTSSCTMLYGSATQTCVLPCCLALCWHRYLEEAKRHRVSVSRPSSGNVEEHDQHNADRYVAHSCMLATDCTRRAAASVSLERWEPRHRPWLTVAKLTRKCAEPWTAHSNVFQTQLIMCVGHVPSLQLHGLAHQRLFGGNGMLDCLPQRPGIREGRSNPRDLCTRTASVLPPNS